MRLIDADIFDAIVNDDGTIDENATETAKNAMLAMPAVDAVPVKHGRWLPKHHYIAGYEFVSGHICSECGNDALNAEGDDFLTEFCPNCGARMDAK